MLKIVKNSEHILALCVSQPFELSDTLASHPALQRCMAEMLGYAAGLLKRPVNIENQDEREGLER